VRNDPAPIPVGFLPNLCAVLFFSFLFF